MSDEERGTTREEEEWVDEESVQVYEECCMMGMHWVSLVL